MTVLRAKAFVRADNIRESGIPFDSVTLPHDERHFRRRLLILSRGDEVMADLPQPIRFASGDCLVLEDGRLAAVMAADEPLYAVHGDDQRHLMRLCWHIGNRHLPCEIEGKRVLIQRDHVIRDMLERLGASVAEVTAPFSPEPGAYHAHGDESHALLRR